MGIPGNRAYMVSLQACGPYRRVQHDCQRYGSLMYRVPQIELNMMFVFIQAHTAHNPVNPDNMSVSTSDYDLILHF